MTANHRPDGQVDGAIRTLTSVGRSILETRTIGTTNIPKSCLHLIKTIGFKTALSLTSP